MIPDTGPVIRIPDTVPFIWIPDNGSLIGTHDTDPLIGIPDNGSWIGIPGTGPVLGIPDNGSFIGIPMRAWAILWKGFSFFKQNYLKKRNKNLPH